MVVPSVALVDRAARSPGRERLAHVAQALQTQLDRDFSAAWGARARISAAGGAAAAPGTWPVYLVDRPQAGHGVHLGPSGEPWAEVVARGRWTLAASHVLLEMVADPRGSRFMEAPSIVPGRQRRIVRYLVDVCDPCQAFHYVIDGVDVSDFVTPDYYRADGTAVDFLRLLQRPLEVRPGCSLSWQDPLDRYWYQKGPDGICNRSRDPIDPTRNPREDRDRAFPPA